MDIFAFNNSWAFSFCFKFLVLEKLADMDEWSASVADMEGSEWDPLFTARRVKYLLFYFLIK
jgi:hypothetical protein